MQSGHGTFVGCGVADVVGAQLDDEGHFVVGGGVVVHLIQIGHPSG